MRLALNRTFSLIVVTGVLLLMAGTSQAATKTWAAAVSGNWSDGTKWSPAGAPANGDTVIITVAGTYTVTLDVSPTLAVLTLGTTSGSTTQTLLNAGQTLSLTGASTINQRGVLEHVSGSINGAGTLTVRGTYNWSGGTMTDAGTTLVAAGGVLNISGDTEKLLFGGRRLNNSGTIIWTGTGIIRGVNDAFINNQSGGVFEARNDAQMIVFGGDGNGQFNNAGIFRKTLSTGTTTIGGTQGFILNNTGTVDIQSGTLRLDIALSPHSSSGAITAAAGAAISFGANTTNITGTYAVALTLVNGGAASFNNPAAGAAVSTNVALSAGTLGGSGVLRVNGTFDWTGGVLNGGGSSTAALFVAPSATMNISGDAQKLLTSAYRINNAGTIVWTGTGTLRGHTDAEINNLAGGLFEVRNDAQMFVGGGDGAARFNNAGTFRKLASNGVTTIGGAQGFTLNNNGIVDIQTGTLRIDNTLDVSNSTGSFTGAPGTTLNFNGGNHVLGSGSSVNFPIVSFTGGTTTITGTYSTPSTLVAGGNANFNGVAGSAVTTNVTLTAGSLGGNGFVRVDGTLDWTGGRFDGLNASTGILTIAPGATMNISGDAEKQITNRYRIDVAGTLLWTGLGNIRGINGAELNTLVGGVFEARNNAQMFVGGGDGSAVFSNAGTLRKVASAGTTQIGLGQGFSLTNTGRIEPLSGVLRFEPTFSGPGLDQSAGNTVLQSGILAGSSLTFDGGLLSGTGTVNGNVLNNGGTLSPGTSPGTITINGNLTQGAGATMEVEIRGLVAGTQFDQVIVNGAVSLGGTLNVLLINNFSPAVGNTFRIITNDGADAVTGTFNGLAEGATFTANGIEFRINYAGGDGNDVLLTVTNDGSCSTVVTTTADTGAGSLREAINCSNSTPGLDTISFNIPGAGVRTIAPATPLPIITDAVIIDGYTQPGSSANTLAVGNNAVLLIELSGANVSSGSGLVIEAGGSTVRGLVINGFVSPADGIGIRLRGGNGNRIEGNFIGTDAGGATARGNINGGIHILTSQNHVIGGPAPAQRNVISGNRVGITVQGPGGIVPFVANVTIQGNYIGTNAGGTAAIRNEFDGITLTGVSGNTIGGTASGTGNVISANGAVGIHLATGIGRIDNNTIQGNFIGTNATGTGALGNVQQGIRINDADNIIGGTVIGARNIISGNGGAGVDVNNPFDLTRNVVVQGNFIGTDITGTIALGNGGGGVVTNAPNTTIGGTIAGAGNRIAFNNLHGVLVVSVPAFGANTTGVVISGNAIFRNEAPGSTALGINLENNTQVNLNDPGDIDTGSNNLQNFPVLTAANNTDTGVRIRGTLNSTPSRTFRVELFSNDEIDPSGFGEGQLFLGSQNVTTNAAGNATFDVTFANAAARNRVITTTATGIDGTSEFSAGLLATTLVPPTATNPVGTSHTVTSTVVLNNQPAQGVTVSFRVLSGPNAGRTGTGITNAAGQTTFTYTGTGGIGTDVIEARGTIGLAPFAAVATKTWTAVAPRIAINDVTVSEGSNGSTLATFTVSLTAASATPVTVNFATANGTATAGTDFTARSGTLTFAPGVTTQPIVISIIGDTVNESDETFFVNLSVPSGATISDGQGVGTIRNDDGVGTIQFIGPAVSAGEGAGSALIIATRTGNSSGTATVNFIATNGTAVIGADYLTARGTLTFGPGEMRKTFVVPIVEDALDEANETVNLTLSNPTGAVLGTPAMAVLTILDNDTPPSLSVNDATVTEGNSGVQNAVFTVTLSAISGQTVQVNFGTLNGTAIAPGDYLTRSGSLIFPPGVRSRTIVVPVNGDLLDEANETYSVVLFTPVSALIADNTGIGTITDNDAPPSLAINDVRIIEGNSGSTPALFTVRLSAASGRSIAVNATTANSTAAAGSDYAATARTLTFAPGVLTRTFAVPVNGDVLDERDETFNVGLSTLVNATLADGQGVGTIVDNDGPTISINDVRVTEGNVGTTNATFIVTLSAASPQSVSVNIATANGTATAGTDYTAINRTLIIPAGTRTVTVAVPVTGDTVNEPDEAFLVVLSTLVNATLARAQGVGTILNDDAPPVPIGPTDVTPQVAIIPGSIVPYPYLPGLFRPTQFQQVVTLQNTSGAPIIGPVTAVLTHLSSGVTLNNANGNTTVIQPVGSPFVNLNVGADNVWSPGEVVTTTLDFTASSSNIGYSVLVFAGAVTR